MHAMGESPSFSVGEIYLSITTVHEGVVVTGSSGFLTEASTSVQPCLVIHR